jgi:hypothetical protein
MKKIAQLILIIGLTSTATSYPMGEWLHQIQQNFLEWRKKRQINKDYTQMIVEPITKLIQDKAKNTPRNRNAITNLFSDSLFKDFIRSTPEKQYKLFLEPSDRILNEISQDPDAFLHQSWGAYQYKRYSDLERDIRQGLSEKVETKVSDLEKRFCEKYPDAKLNLYGLYLTSLNKMNEREQQDKHEQRDKQLQKPAYFEKVIAIGWGE